MSNYSATKMLASLSSLILPIVAQAQISTHVTYDEHIKKSRSFEILDENLFGDRINLQEGVVSFAQTDIILSTNSDLKVRLGRSTPTANIQTNTPQFNVFGYNWLLDVPYMTATYDSRDGWNAYHPQTGDIRRCRSGAIAPRERTGPYPYYYTQLIYAHMYWKGVQINIPGYGNEQMLRINSGQVIPNDGKAYYGTTKSHWKVGCLDNVSNDAGEGFTVTLPDGVVYHFNWMVKRKAVDLTDNGVTDAQGNGTDPWHLLAPLTQYILYATKAVDRYGNTVTYTYDEVHQQRLKSIESDDGVRIDVSYDVNGLLSSVTSAGRTWTYSYAGNRLASLQLPDGGRWEFSDGFYYAAASPYSLNFWSNGCGQDQGNMNAANPPESSTLKTLFITHPSGAHGEFVLRPLYHGINNAPGGCGLFGSAETSFSWGTYGVPSAYGVMSLHSKKISGPGMQDRIWTYGYAPTWSFQSQCGSGCSSSATTSVTTNDGILRRYTYGNDFFHNYGQLLSETIEDGGGARRSTTHTYVSSVAGQPFPDNSGDIALSNGNVYLYGNPFGFKNRPRNSSLLSEGGVSYSDSVEEFDIFARPVKRNKSNSLGYERSEVTDHYDNLALWVLGQPLRRYDAVSGMVESQIDYDSLARPWKTYRFGKLGQITTYHSDGTVATTTDGRGSVTSFSEWKRGIPQLIRHPVTPEASSGATEVATVNDSGWITSVTDEVGSITGYGYDAMGRLASIVYPTGDGVSYLTTYRNFQPIAANDWKPEGFSVGQWRLIEVTGNRIAITYMDALWRPVLKHEYDNQNVAATLRSSKTAYDTNGRVSFQSYPSSENIPGNTGTRTFYDTLGRVTRVEQDAESNTVLTTTTEYLPGLKTKITNPKGFSTTTSFMAWDQPTYDFPILSEQPEGKLIQIGRHPYFGWPLQLTQRNAAGTLSATRRYVYDGNAQLCKTIEPETGVTVMGYDEAGNPVWQAAGLDGNSSAYNSTTDCQRAAAYGAGRTVTRTYDARNRLTHLTFPNGGIGNQIWTYEKDSLPKSVTAYNSVASAFPVITTYTYNKRRLLTGETLAQPTWYSWSAGYAYDSYGHLSTQTYPTGLVVDYAPNPLGQSTKAGVYASGAQYYPNGALKQFTYGNGIVHTMTQNARQLPSQVTSAGVSNYTYNYDGNGNVTNIWDLARGDNYSRWLQYDQLDRLTDAGSGSFGGDAWHRMTYDALDNIRSWKLAGVKDYADYVYDVQNRLTSIRNTAGATVVGLAYDPQGNLLNKNGQGYVFDFGNRLRNVSDKEAYRYDGFGRRVTTWKLNNAAELWMYSQAGQMLFSSDWEGTGYLNHKTHEHVYLAGSLIASIDHAWPSNAVLATKYQHTDALGSPIAVTNESGQLIERMDYEPWGAIIGKPNHNGIGYTGHVMDGLTGLTYMQQRYYDQSIGRFLSVDPVTANASTGSNLNRYWYADDSPYNFTDPDGRCSKDRSGYHANCKPSAFGMMLQRILLGFSGANANMKSTHPNKINQEDANKIGVQSTAIITGGAIATTGAIAAPQVAVAAPVVVADGASAVSAATRTKTFREIAYATCVGIGVCNGGVPSHSRTRQHERIQEARIGSRRDSEKKKLDERPDLD